MDFKTRSPEPNLDYGSRSFIFFDAVPVILFFIGAVLFRKHIDNIAYLIALGILLIATVVKIALSFYRLSNGKNNKSMDDAFQLILGPGLFAFVAGIFWKIFTDHSLIFDVIGKPPRVIFFLLFVVFWIFRLVNAWLLQRNEEPTLGNRRSKYCDLGSNLCFLVFSILCMFV
ncbi:MAG: hypothetical protein IKI32_03685 [Lachnospiraceae bacterium]|nr:hypothetical protein [Lachnospiraceae bacterium]MBR7076007.1 hypothetical protein [Lachnospiraceae bacterium]